MPLVETITWNRIGILFTDTRVIIVWNPELPSCHIRNFIPMLPSSTHLRATLTSYSICIFLPHHNPASLEAGLEIRHLTRATSFTAGWSIRIFPNVIVNNKSNLTIQKTNTDNIENIEVLSGFATCFPGSHFRCWV